MSNLHVALLASSSITASSGGKADMQIRAGWFLFASS
jgi:hypothetical protein